jgi:membrane protein DedA with SNARE-associated domain
MGALGAPVPEELVLMGGGAAAHRGVALFFVMLGVAAVTVVLTDLAVFGIGHHLGPGALSRRPARWLLSSKTRARVERAIDRHHTKMIFIARFLPGLRAPTILVLGAHKVSPWRFLVFDSLSVLVSVPMMVGIGYLASSSIDRITSGFTHAKHLVILAVGLLIAIASVVSVVRALRKRRVRADELDVVDPGTPISPPAPETPPARPSASMPSAPPPPP